jgi:hypothetical protein
MATAAISPFAEFPRRLRTRMAELAQKFGETEFFMPVGLFLVVDKENGGDATAEELVSRFEFLDFESRNVVDFYFLGWLQDSGGNLKFSLTDFRQFRSFLIGKGIKQFGVTCPLTYPELAKDPQLSAKTDLSYRLCYRACAGGSFRWPANAGEITCKLGQVPPKPLETWDNDGIVNTASMLWPRGERVLVMADHLDIVGHDTLEEVPEAKQGKGPYGVARRYQAYDALQSTPQFTGETFNEIWSEIFDFAANRRKLSQKKTQPKLIKRVAAAAGSTALDAVQKRACGRRLRWPKTDHIRREGRRESRSCVE